MYARALPDVIVEFAQIASFVVNTTGVLEAPVSADLARRV